MREDGNSTPNPPANEAPAVDATTATLVSDAPVGTIASLNGEVNEPLAGVKTITIPDSGFPEEFNATVNGVAVTGVTNAQGTSTIRVNTNDELPETSEVVLTGVERISVDGNTISVKLFANDDLTALKSKAEGKLSENAKATITTPKGNTVEVDLVADTAIEQILATLTANNVTAADLIAGGSYTVELKDTQGAATTYTIKF